MRSAITKRAAATMRRLSLTALLCIEAACIMPPLVAAAAGAPLVVLWTALRVVASVPLWAVNALHCALIPGNVPRWRVDLAQIRDDFTGANKKAIRIDLAACQQHAGLN